MKYLRGINVAAAILLLTMGLGSWVDIRSDEIQERHWAIETAMQDMIQLKQELQSMLKIAALEQNPLRASRYEAVRADLVVATQVMTSHRTESHIAVEIAMLVAQEEKSRVIEKAAIELMRAANWNEARRLLFAESYTQNQAIYEIDVETALSAVKAQLDASRKQFDRLRVSMHILRFGAVLLLLWIGAKYSRQLRQQLREQTRSQADLSATQKTLRDLTAHEQAEREAGRKRVAQEIHDELGQRLTVLRMDVAMLPRAVAADPAGLLPARVAGLKAGIDGVLSIVRDIAGKLRPAALEIGLAPAAEALLQEFRETLGIPCELENRLPANLVLDDVRATGVFRILQESLTNIARHAQARQIKVSLSVRDQVLRLLVQDDGQGFVEGKNTAFGVPGMRERATSLGGSLRIYSGLNAGTTVEALIPLDVALSPATKIRS